MSDSLPSASKPCSEASPESQSLHTLMSVMQKFTNAETRYQGVYFEVHVECNDPEVPRVEPIVYKSDRNRPRPYLGSQDWASRFLHRYDQLVRCINTTERLYREAIEAQHTLQEHFKSKKFNVHVVRKQG